MKGRKPEEYLLAAAVIAAIIIACCFTKADAQNPDWYEACKPDDTDYSAWAKCTTDQMGSALTVIPECFGQIDANCLYQAVQALHPNPLLSAPDGLSWRVHYWARDENARKAEACVACLKRARNRARCGC